MKCKCNGNFILTAKGYVKCVDCGTMYFYGSLDGSKPGWHEIKKGWDV